MKKIVLIFMGGFLALAASAMAIDSGAKGGSLPSTSEGVAAPSTGGTAREIFGGRRGYFHPFLAVGEYYTDNLFNNRDRQSDTFTLITPGIWLALPASRQQLLQVTTLDSAPGGLEVGRFQIETARRFQGYALYRANIERHNRFSQEDSVYQRGEGLLNVNFRGGLSIQLFDVYEKDHDPYGTGTSVQLDKFRSNLVNLSIGYRLSPKTQMRLDYSNFSLQFNAARNDFRNRDDNMVSAYLFYRILPKTSLLLEYDFIDIDYETDVLNDSKEHHFLAGFLWKITGKTRAQIKMGVNKREFDDTDQDLETFLAELRLDYLISPKTSIYLTGTRKPIETDIQGSRDILSYRIRAGYLQKFNAKLNGTANLYYIRNHYNGIAGTQNLERKDNYYGAGLGVGYALNSWFNMGLQYDYIQRDSDSDSFDYRTNTVFLRLTAAI